jgi:hypothetical protein
LFCFYILKGDSFVKYVCFKHIKTEDFVRNIILLKLKKIISIFLYKNRTKQNTKLSLCYTLRIWDFYFSSLYLIKLFDNLNNRIKKEAYFLQSIVLST